MTRYEYYKATVHINEDVAFTVHFEADSMLDARQEVLDMLKKGVGGNGCGCCETYYFTFSLSDEAITNAAISIQLADDWA